MFKIYHCLYLLYTNELFSLFFVLFFGLHSDIHSRRTCYKNAARSTDGDKLKVPKNCS